MVGRAPDTGGQSPVLGQACSTESREDALAHADGTRRSSGLRAPLLVLEQYRDTNYRDGVINSLYGTDGPCGNGVTYTRINPANVALHVPSMKGYNNCNKAVLTDLAGLRKNIDLPAPTLGLLYNDMTDIVDVSNG
ncbi:hypothetical protein AB0O91_17280 [Kitasatospora sp. NPDC089797]|uniref:hypothetical protein n=1 Tax=Kitasatospora sp. NPDC089797 TaxID=3155298 RepID=UPI00341E79EF